MGGEKGINSFRLMPSLPRISGVQTLRSDEAEHKRKGRRERKVRDRTGHSSQGVLGICPVGCRRANISVGIPPM